MNLAQQKGIWGPAVWINRHVRPSFDLIKYGAQAGQNRWELCMSASSRMKTMKTSFNASSGFQRPLTSEPRGIFTVFTAYKNSQISRC